MDVSRDFILIEFGGILRLVKSSKFLRRGVDISGNLISVEFGEILR